MLTNKTPNEVKKLCLAFEEILNARHKNGDARFLGNKKEFEQTLFGLMKLDQTDEIKKISIEIVLLGRIITRIVKTCNNFELHHESGSQILQNNFKYKIKVIQKDQKFKIKILIS